MSKAEIVSQAAVEGYEGGELDAMAEARRYYAWIYDRCRPYLGPRILEVGAGLGHFSAQLLAGAPERLCLLEPSRRLEPRLRARFAGDRRVTILHAALEQLPGVRDEPFDSVVCINVLEHLEDDLGALRAMRAQVRDSGHLLLFVPAGPYLFNALDEAFGHRRRYRRSDLVARVQAAGWRILDCRYLNLPGVLGWWYVGRLRRRRGLDLRAVRWYDRYVIPIVMRLERRLSPPVGQSLLLVACAVGRGVDQAATFREADVRD